MKAPEEIASQITEMADWVSKAGRDEETEDMFVRFAEMAWAVAGDGKPGTGRALTVLHASVLAAATAIGMAGN